MDFLVFVALLIGVAARVDCNNLHDLVLTGSGKFWMFQCEVMNVKHAV